jgi:hypothetical protein
MGQVTLELSEATLRKATALADKKGVPLSTFLAYQIDELIEANDRYERAKATVAKFFPETNDTATLTDDPQTFFDRWQNGPT